MLRDHGIAISMDGRGRCHDNIFVERLWWTVKHEWVYLRPAANGIEQKRRLAHRSAARHKLHSTPQQDRMNLIRGKVKPPAGYRPLAYSSPEAVQTTGTVAVLQPSEQRLARASARRQTGQGRQYLRFSYPA